MPRISDHIERVNSLKEKVLSIFLTAGYTDKDNFVSHAVNIIEAGADMLEIGIPFSDPLADGPVIQSSSQTALSMGVQVKDALNFVSAIKAQKDIPLVLMGYANPILRYGVNEFIRDACNAGAEGLIVPDVPIEEYDSFFCSRPGIDVILLITPASSVERIKQIDTLSRGFVYCVSVTGTTGMQKKFSEESIASIKRAYSLVENKMLLGFGISGPESIKQVRDHCDGVIVGSAVVKSLRDNGIEKTVNFVQELKRAAVSLD